MNEGSQASRGPGGELRIAYLIPEFPGQTHAFFWRERRRLERLGVRVDLFTTRQPPPSVRARHDWAEAAEASTAHLVPLGWIGAIESVTEILRAGPRGWGRVARCLWQSEAPGLKGRARLAAALLLGARLSARSRRQGVAHVHVHSCADAANVALLANRLSGLGYSLTLHNPLDCYGPNQPQKWKHARFAIVITRKILAEVEEELEGMLPPRVFVAPMGVDEEAFCRVESYEPCRGGDRFRIFSCSRINPGKAIDDLVRAMARLEELGVDAELRVAGADDVGGSYRDELLALAAELGVSDRVHLLGSLSEHEVLAELRAAHAFGLASHAEPLGIAIAEAMAVELPVVATAAGGVPELVTDGVDGLLVPPRAPEAFAEALARIARDPELAERLSARSRKTILESFHSGVSASAIHEGIRRPAH